MHLAVPADQHLDQVGDRAVITKGRDPQGLFEGWVDAEIEGGDFGGDHACIP